MRQVTKTIKLKFLDLNKVKADMFAEAERENTRLANELLAMPIKERRKMTTGKIVTSLKSAIANQVIRHTNSKAHRNTKSFKKLPVEVNCQNWKLTKVGETYSISFPTLHGVKRVPVEIASKHWQPILDGLLTGCVSGGSVKIIKHRGHWYAYMSVSWEVPEGTARTRIGCDRGQNQLAVAAPLRGFGKFFSGKEIKHRRRHYQKRRKQLQEAGKYRALKKWDKKERRWMEAVNHTVSRRIVRFAQHLKADVVIEDLSGCRQTMQQRKKNRSDAGESRHSWAFYSLELKLDYKLNEAGYELIKRPAPYTSKTSSIDGRLGKRCGNCFYAPSGEVLQSDLNAAWNLAQWDGFSCSLDLQKAIPVMGLADLGCGQLGTALNSMNTDRGRVEYRQLSLFDTTSFGTRRENPTCF